MTTDLAGWNVHGPVRTVRREIAEWDDERQTWNAPWGTASAAFGPDGLLTESTHENRDGTVSRGARVGISSSSVAFFFGSSTTSVP